MLGKRLSVIRIVLAATVVVWLGCDVGSRKAGNDPEISAAEKIFDGNYPIRIVCTTGPVADMLRSLGLEHVEVFVLMGPGVDPHLYRESPSDIEKLSTADAIFYNGLHLEGRMGDLFEKLAARRPTFAVTQGLVDNKEERLRKPPEFEGYFDPHVWHDPKLWSECAAYVAVKLGEFDPQHRADYLAASEEYRKTLDGLDQSNHETLAKIPQNERVLVSAHDAFGYFCQAYDLESMPLGGISTEDEVSIGRLDEVVNFLVHRKIKAVFVESAVAPRIVEALIEPCRKQGHEVKIGGELYADALGPKGSGAESYVGMIKANVDTIVKALE